MDDLMPAYEGLMFWYRHELCRLRASRRAGFPTRTERRAIIREMLSLRRRRPAHKTIASPAHDTYTGVTSEVT